MKTVAIFTDAHGLLEPTKAVLEDISKRKINEIYSLGDNIGVGPNPKEVIALLEAYHVISIAGNYEDYINLGLEPFTYFNKQKKKSYLWTLSKLSEREKKIISMYPHSIELTLGGKKIALCHFANDVRMDYHKNNTWKYQNNIKNKGIGYKQFLYTNSEKQIKEIDKVIKNYDASDPFIKGYLSAKSEPLFAGKKVTYFDAVIQGHVHWKIYEYSDSTVFYSIRAVGIAYGNDQIDTASYVILTEKENGFDFEEVLVRFDRKKMEDSILNSDSPDTKIYKFTNFEKKY